MAFFIPSGVLDFDELCLIFMDAVIDIVSGMLNEIELALLIVYLCASVVDMFTYC